MSWPMLSKPCLWLHAARPERRHAVAARSTRIAAFVEASSYPLPYQASWSTPTASADVVVANLPPEVLRGLALDLESLRRDSKQVSFLRPLRCPQRKR